MQNAFHIVEERYGSRLDCVIHLAAYYSFDGRPSPMYKKLTVDGTERLLRELHRFDVGQLIFSSTMLVHAPGHPGQRINEQSPICATWAYPQSKIETEHKIAERHGDIPAVILRIAGVYTDLCESVPLAHQIQRIYEKQLTSHVYPGDVHSGQSFVHLDDLIESIVLSIEARDELEPLEVFLIGEPDTMTYEELQRETGLLIHGKDWETMYVPKPIAKAGAWVQNVVPIGDRAFIKPWMVDRADDNYVLVISKARNLLGWEPQRSLRLVLPRMIDGLKVDPERWYKINKLHPPIFRIDWGHDHHVRKSA